MKERTRHRVTRLPGFAPGGPADQAIDTVVIGGGQAGLATGYYLKRAGVPFVILDAETRTGDVWRRRWDSLRLFTPAAFSSLPGLPHRTRGDHFPTHEEFADYLEAYAHHFELPVRHGARVDNLQREDDRFLVAYGPRQLTARNVIVAMANYQRPKVPAFAAELAEEVVQLHSSEYRNPGQLPATGTVLVVGGGNSGAEIALELAQRQPVLLSGRYPGHLPFDIDSRVAHAFLIRIVLRGLFHRVLTVGTPMGRRLKRRNAHHSGPLIRTKKRHLEAAGVVRVPRTVNATEGKPVLEDGSSPDVAAVVWCTGYRPGFEWIDLPLAFDDGYPRHDRGLVEEVPGLYFVGLHFLSSLSSVMIHGVGRDAARIVDHVRQRSTAGTGRDETTRHRRTTAEAA